MKALSPADSLELLAARPAVAALPLLVAALDVALDASMPAPPAENPDPDADAVPADVADAARMGDLIGVTSGDGMSSSSYESVL